MSKKIKFYEDSAKTTQVYPNIDPDDAADFEKIENKVTSVSSSSTDTQYPSAKCVYDTLTNYVEFTDYATDSVGGTMVSSPTYGTSVISANGRLFCDEITYSNYSSYSQYGFIGKGTLENVLTGKGLVTSTTISSSSTDSTIPTSKAVYDYISSLDATDISY